MSTAIEKVIRLPQTLKNPFKQPTDEEKVVKVIASLNSLPDFQGQEEELASVINIVTSKPETPQEIDLGHSPEDLDLVLKLLESRTSLGQLPELTTKRYMDALRFQKEVSLQKPPSLSRQIDSALARVHPAVGIVASNLIISIPIGYFAPYSSVPDYLLRVSIATALAFGLNAVIERVAS